MAAEMKVTDAAVEAALSAKLPNGELVRYTIRSPFDATIMRAALEAGLAAMLEPVGKLPDHAMQRLKAINWTGWDDLFSLESDVPDAHIAYVIKESQ